MIRTVETWFVTGGSGFVGRNLIRDLIADGHIVRALARSEAAREQVAALGAEPVAGDLADAEALRAGMQGCAVVVHAAAEVSEWGDPAHFHAVNVEGTRQVLAAARAAAVPRLIHIGTEAPYATGEPIVDIDEEVPFPRQMLPRYPQTKGEAEQLVRAANGDGLETVVVRPRLIWGDDDTSLLPQLIAAVRSGRFRWIAGGQYLTSSCHVRNLVHGIRLAARRGKPGAAYFLTDGAPVSVRGFLSRLMEARGVRPPTGEVPRKLVWWLATAGEFLWQSLPLKGQPPVTRVGIALLGVQVTVRDQKARREIGYAPVVELDDGLAEMRTQS